MYLGLASMIEGQLRDAYAKRHEEGLETQSSLAAKLGVHRSVVSRRLQGRANLTVETIADLVWALGHAIRVEVFDPNERLTNSPFVRSEHAQPKASYPVSPQPPSTATSPILSVLSSTPREELLQ
jgi:transcriptional regulator with XRE-family HTH domain